MQQPVWRQQKYKRAQGSQEARDTNVIPRIYAQACDLPHPSKSAAYPRQVHHTAPRSPPRIWFRIEV